MINFLTNIILRVGVVISMILKKSSEGMATATNIAPAPTIKPETENIVVKKQEDNYHKETVGKSYRQLMYEKTVKEQGIVENPYLEWEKLVKYKDPNWAAKATSMEDTKKYLNELKMTEEQFIEFRKNIEAKTKKHE